MNNINELLSDIDARIKKGLIYSGAKYYQQAILQVKNEKTFPMSIGPNASAKMISLDSQYALQSYHRIISSTTETDPTRGKGKRPYQMRVYTMRNVWLGNLRKLPKKHYDTIDDVKSDVYKVFPVVLTNKEIVQSTEESVDRNEIFEEEFNGNEIKSLNAEVIAFYIEYEIRQKIVC